LKSGSWYLRFYTDVKGERKQVARFLTRKDEKHHSKTCKPVRDLAASVIAKENSEAIIEAEKAQTLTEFWEATYEPYIRDSKRLSTQHSYTDLWTRHVEPIIGPVELPAIRTRDVSLLLTDMAKKGHGRNSIAHVRSLISGILAHAVNLGLLESNPVRDCKVLAAIKQSKPTEFYTEQEVETILMDLDDMPNCQAVCAVLFYCGLRPSECAGLKWTDIDLENRLLTVRRSHVRGEISDQLKTPESHRTLPLVPQVLGPLMAWRKLSPGDGWVFENKLGKPTSLREMARRWIVPRLKEKGREWKSFYSFRRGLATLITRLRGPLAASQALGHRNMTVTMTNYVRQDKRELEAAMKMLERHTTSM
jgi:integrase